MYKTQRKRSMRTQRHIKHSKKYLLLSCLPGHSTLEEAALTQACQMVRGVPG